MLENKAVFKNGGFVPWHEATVHLMSHSLGRGTAVFEVLSIHQTMQGPALFRLKDHLNRLFLSAQAIGATLSMSKEEIASACLETVRRNRTENGFVKIVCYHSAPAFGILPPRDPMDVVVFSLDPVADLGGLSFPFERGATACFSKWCKLDPRTTPVEAKVAANYLNGMMARMEAGQRGYDNVIMRDTQGFVAEGGTESIFMVKDGRIYTPCAGTVLLSITRDAILQVAEELGIPRSETRIHPDRLLEADELFFSGTPNKVLPVRRIEKRALSPTPGTVTRKISNLMADIVAGRNDRFRPWLSPVT